jgi:hypothetical protein
MSEKQGTSEERHVVWGGLAARCSACSWTRAYDPAAKDHQMPKEELSEIVREEFRKHKCRDFPKNDPVSLRASYSIESGSLSELLNPASLSRVTATTSNWFHQIFNCMDCGTNVVLALRTWIATTTLAGLLKGLQTILKGEHHVS